MHECMDGWVELAGDACLLSWLYNGGTSSPLTGETTDVHLQPENSPVQIAPFFYSAAFEAVQHIMYLQLLGIDKHSLMKCKMNAM